MMSEKKYYTLVGLDGVYEDYNEAVKNVKNKATDYPVPFSAKDDAEAFRQGKWDEYLEDKLEKNHAVYETDADAVIYADGSVDVDKNDPTGGYGIIIFFKSGEVICESATLKDKANGELLSRRFDENGNLKEEKIIAYPIIKGAKEGFVKSGNNEAGEPEAARRALEICFLEKGAKKVILVYDSKTIEERYHNGILFKSTKPEHPANFYGTLCAQIKEKYGEDAVRFIHVDSHRGVPKGNKPAKPAYRIDEMEFVHAVFNDMVDAMAKAEAGIGEVSRKESVNLMHVIPEKHFKIETRNKSEQDGNKKKVRELLQLVLEKKWFRPRFK